MVSGQGWKLVPKVTSERRARLLAGFATTLLSTAFGCSSSAYEEYAFGEPVVLREDPKLQFGDLAQARTALQASRKELEVARLRSEWLSMELELAKARVVAVEARERQDDLRVEIARFRNLEARLPKGENLVEPLPMDQWEEKLTQYSAETARRDAKVRLLNRKVKPIRLQALEAGIVPADVRIQDNELGEP